MRKSTRHLVLLIGWLALALLVPGSAAAQTPTLSVDPDDTPLVINGTLDGQTTAFSGNLRLTVSGADVSELQLLASELRHADDDSVVIDRTHVSIPAGVSLSDGQPRDVRVTVNNVKRPGDYAGELEFRLPNQPEAAALVVPLALHIDAQPDVVPVTENMTFQMVRCQPAIDCALATWLLPDSVVRQDWLVQLDNRTLTPVEITAGTVVMRGDKTGNAVRVNEVSLDTPHTLPSSQVEPVALTIHPNRLSPDRYQGTLRFKAQGSDTPVTVNVDLSVREGPFWPLLVVLFGIIVGRLVQKMETPAVKTQIKLMPRFYELQARVDDVKNPAAQSHVSAQVQEVKRSIEGGQESEEALSQALDKLDAHISFLVNLEELERELEQQGLDALKAELQPQINKARQLLLDDQADEAEQLRRTIETRLREAQRDGSMGAAADRFAELLGLFRAGGTKLAQAEAAAPPERPGGDRWGWLAQLMATLSGVQLLSADVRYWLVRPLLSIVLLVALALLGLQTLYVNAGSTFGAAGLYDYLGLFLWGLSADVAQRTLQNLQQP